MESLFEIAKYTIPALVVLATAYFLIQSFLQHDTDKRNFEYRLANHKIALPIRLQAYERMAMFLERIAPNNMILRVKTPGMSARDFQIALLNTIRAEFEHNLSQQIYISPEAWIQVANVKEEIVKAINLNAGKMQENSTAIDLSKKIFEYFISNEDAMPTQKAMDILKSEVRKIY